MVGKILEFGFSKTKLIPSWAKLRKLSFNDACIPLLNQCRYNFEPLLLFDID
ncbi:Uncharacterized protein APZ42_014713 [Daphnia magna]|uniref:Uncharacterized protein n=1 Tax=Daphnia magna TaxID=35525 RepID=A0A162PN67_9CRUS|nr:Uncharacterized protein APZ42_014713 [Daphnia magna]